MQNKLLNLQDKNFNKVIKNLIKTIVGIESIILFGSRARNEAFSESDFDLILIAPFQDSIFDRLKSIYASIPPTLKIEAFGYTAQEFEHMLYSFHIIALEVLNDGIPLYDRGYFKRLHEEFRQLQAKGLKRQQFYWVHPSQQ